MGRSQLSYPPLPWCNSGGGSSPTRCGVEFEEVYQLRVYPSVVPTLHRRVSLQTRQDLQKSDWSRPSPFTTRPAGRRPVSRSHFRLTPVKPGPGGGRTSRHCGVRGPSERPRDGQVSRPADLRRDTTRSGRPRLVVLVRNLKPSSKPIPGNCNAYFSKFVQDMVYLKFFPIV